MKVQSFLVEASMSSSAGLIRAKDSRGKTAEWNEETADNSTTAQRHNSTATTTAQRQQ
jgi:hypothetical protein